MTVGARRRMRGQAGRAAWLVRIAMTKALGLNWLRAACPGGLTLIAR